MSPRLPPNTPPVVCLIPHRRAEDAAQIIAHAAQLLQPSQRVHFAQAVGVGHHVPGRAQLTLVSVPHVVTLHDVGIGCSLHDQLQALIADFDDEVATVAESLGVKAVHRRLRDWSSRSLRELLDDYPGSRIVLPHQDARGRDRVAYLRRRLRAVSHPSRNIIIDDFLARSG